MRVVVDTNIAVSAALWGGTPQLLFILAVQTGLILLTSDELIRELETTLSKSKFEKYLLLRAKTASEMVAEFVAASTVVEPVPVPQNIVRDPKDIMVLAAAVGGNADYILSGDKDLLSLNSYAGIPILKVADFLTFIDSEE